MGRVLIVLLGIVVLIAGMPSFAGECGDVDGQEGVNILDIVHLINYKYKDGPPPFCGTLTDYDGNDYETVTIGDQVWMAENLKVTHYHNGDAIPNVTNGTTWGGLSTGAYCDYGNNPGNGSTYGHLYNWFAVEDSRNIAPEGWHIPTDDEWKELEIYLGMSPGDADLDNFRGTDEGGKLKDLLSGLWTTPNNGATNETGFTGLPGGLRSFDGSSYSMNLTGLFWSATEQSIGEAKFRALDFDYAQVYRYHYLKVSGMSIRCIKD